jgi:hypothetical protein
MLVSERQFNLVTGPVSEKVARNKHSVQHRGRLHQDRFGKLCGEMVNEHAHG